MAGTLGIDTEEVLQYVNPEEPAAEKANDILSMLLTHFGTDVIYDYAHYFAVYVTSWLSPLLLVLAIIYAIGHSQLNMITSSKGQTAEVIFSAIFYAIALTLYFILGFYALEWFTALYKLGGDQGSINNLTAEMDRLFVLVEDKNDDIINDWSDLFKLPGFVVVWAFFYASYFVLAGILLIFRFGQAMFFGVLFVWGTIAIPLSASIQFQPVKHWILLFSVALFWPFVESILIIFISGVFSLGIERAFAEAPDTSQISALFAYYTVFSILNVILISVVVVAPMLTAVLIGRVPFVGAVAMPIAGAAFTDFLLGFAKGKVSSYTQQAWQQTTSVGRSAAGRTLNAGRGAFVGSSLSRRNQYGHFDGSNQGLRDSLGDRDRGDSSSSTTEGASSQGLRDSVDGRDRDEPTPEDTSDSSGGNE